MATVAKQKVINLFTFDNLSDEAKQRAHNEYIENIDFFTETIREDYTTLLNILGFNNVDILYSGFYCQGDGACFTGTYAYSKGWKSKLTEYLGTHKPEWLTFGKRLQDIQSKYFYELTASLIHQGRYCHEFSVNRWLESPRLDIGALVEGTFASICIDICRLIYKGLQDEYEYQTSYENFEEIVAANEWLFDVNGLIDSE